MADDVVIRPAVAADAERIHRAVMGIARTLDEADRVVSTPQDIRRHGFGEKPAFEALIAEAGGETAGVCVFFPSFSTYRGRPGAYVLDLYVDPRWRGQGVGARLLQRVASVTRARGGVYLRLSVDAANAGAEGFYERLGVRRVAGERIHAAYGDDFAALADGGDRPAPGERT